VAYSEGLYPQRKAADEAADEAAEVWQLVDGWTIATQQQYKDCGDLLKEVKAKYKFLEEERTISVSPLNDEVKRVNAWYKPATEKLKAIVEHATKLMAQYILKQKAEEQRLLEEAEAAARAVLSTNPDVGEALVEATEALVTSAANAVAPKIDKIAAKPVWSWRVVNAEALVRAHPELSMPDPKKVAAWISEHGNKDVPVGVEVEADVKFTVRS
jgi:hypothetical protein